ncbi:unnamed protein product [Kuraishia capsulata CBS 1993]|uniref:Histone-lysine N-methyltransferase, H3 lysine-79 specific n=1 Tax=Kuraishia capsulata CBS 1993 TaxID=1382522 RepID=W6MU99_9ASCO|nr:uncharacterized protein KUCA_T00005013001 [Kuraishia capsulata CBS 1993]CDK29027.1 unnamed protein product [Kuraishia capsulata CBS 1993]
MSQESPSPSDQLFDSVDRNVSASEDTGTPEPREKSVPEPKKRKRGSSMLAQLTADADWYMTSFSGPESKTRDSSVKFTEVKEKLREEIKIHPRPAQNKDRPHFPRPNPLKREKKSPPKRSTDGSVKAKKPSNGETKTAKPSNGGLSALLESASYFTSLGSGDTDSFLRRVKPKIEREPSPPPSPIVKKKAVIKNTVNGLIKKSLKKASPHVTKSLKKELKEPKKEPAKDTKVSPKKPVKSSVAKIKKIQGKALEKEDPVRTKESTPAKVEKIIPLFVSWSDNTEIPIGNRPMFLDEIYKGSMINTIDNDVLVPASELVYNNQDAYINDTRFSEIELATPFSSFREKYTLQMPKDQQLNPFEEIGRIMELVAYTYIPEPYRLQVLNLNRVDDCIVGKYIKAVENGDGDLVVSLVNEYNAILDKLRISGEIFKYTANLKTFPLLCFHEILNQCYSRSVSPNSRKLRDYKAFSNFVYGELLPNFLTTVYNQVGLNHTHRFIDLGSGVGNCTLQAALEFGAESAGCEIMDHASTLSELQLKEFEQRCKIYGLRTGSVSYFLRQGFEENPDVEDYVNKSDIILVNNYLFDSELNQKVVELFRGLRVGTKIISLKPIVPHGYTMNLVDLECILNRTSYVQYSYDDNSVSWTSTGGIYYISTVEKDIIPSYFVEHSVGRTRGKKTMTPDGVSRASTPSQG